MLSLAYPRKEMEPCVNIMMGERSEFVEVNEVGGLPCLHPFLVRPGWHPDPRTNWWTALWDFVRLVVHP